MITATTYIALKGFNHKLWQNKDTGINFVHYDKSDGFGRLEVQAQDMEALTGLDYLIKEALDLPTLVWVDIEEGGLSC